MQQQGRDPPRGAGAAHDHREPLRARGGSGQEHLPGSALHVHRRVPSSTRAARCSGCCSSTSTTPAAARWPRRSAIRSASPSSSSPAPASSASAIDPATVTFLQGARGSTSPGTPRRRVDQIPHLDHYQIIVALAKEAQRVFPPPPTKVVCLDWSVRDPSTVKGTPDEVRRPTRRPTSSSTLTFRTWSKPCSATRLIRRDP